MTAFHWFLPTGGDARSLDGNVHGTAIGASGSTAVRTSAAREPTLDYLSQIAGAADTLGYEAVLTPTGAHCEDAWLTTAALIAATRRLKFLVAFRPGLVEPALAAQMAATFQRLSSGRLLLNLVIGSSQAEQLSYGDSLDHDERYARAGEFMDVVRACWSGERFDHAGPFYTLAGGQLRQPPDPVPEVYLGGSSAPAIELAARHADVYLTWGEPPAQAADKLEQVRRRAKELGREVRFGIRLQVITRDTADQAWADAERLVAGLDDRAIAAGQTRLRGLESEGQRRMLDLHGGDRERLVVAPNLWAGPGLVRGGAGTALVGSHAEVRERIAEYEAIGISEFIFSGYPHLEEAYAFAEGGDGAITTVTQVPNPFWPALRGPLRRLAVGHESAVRFHPEVNVFAALPDEQSDLSWRALAELLGPDGVATLTAEPGGFVGVRRKGRLVAMAGLRVRVPGATEISSVCTHPDFRGFGLARRLVRHLVGRIERHGEFAFLHTAADNGPAIQLYEGLGFEPQGRPDLVTVRPPGRIPT